MDQGNVIHRLTVLFRWSKVDVFRYMPCLFIKTVSQARDYPQHLDLAAGEESHLQRHLALYMLGLRF